MHVEVLDLTFLDPSYKFCIPYQKLMIVGIKDPATMHVCDAKF